MVTENDIMLWKWCISDYLARKPYTLSVKDGSKSQSPDIIELMWTRSKNGRSLDSKVKEYIESVGIVFDEEGRDDGSLFFEILVHKDPVKAGWFYGNNDHLAYVDINRERLCLMRFEPVRSWVLNQISSFTRKFIRYTDRNGESYHSVGLLVPENTLVKHMAGYVEIVENLK